jgi:hypothetical protein
MQRWQVIFWVVVLGFLATIGGIFGVQYLMRSSHLGKFKSHLGEYTAQPSRPAAAPASPYVKGKVIPVEFKDGAKDIDWIYWDMPKDLRADNPDEVGTVVWLEWSDKQVGEYTDNSKALVWLCKVSVIDLGAKTLVGQRDFQGSDPPQSDSGSGDVHGSKPTKEIVDYLKNLPRQ